MASKEGRLSAKQMAKNLLDPHSSSAESDDDAFQSHRSTKRGTPVQGKVPKEKVKRPSLQRATAKEDPFHAKEVAKQFINASNSSSSDEDEDDDYVPTDDESVLRGRKRDRGTSSDPEGSDRSVKPPLKKVETTAKPAQDESDQEAKNAKVSLNMIYALVQFYVINVILVSFSFFLDEKAQQGVPLR